MKVFIFYSNFDPTKEPHGKVLAGSLKEAKQKVSQIKNLPLKMVSKLFKVTPQN